MPVNMPRIVLSFIVTAACSTAALAGAPCEEIVRDTLAEMRAGAGTSWSDEMEATARSAAGAACIKAQSGRYGVDRAPVAASVDDRAAGVEAVSPAAAQEGKAGASAAAGTEAVEEDDGSFSVGGVTFRSLKGSPSRKPYERARNNDD
jgi:hypothetical protein